jgi:hypothetical protein
VGSLTAPLFCFVVDSIDSGDAEALLMDADKWNPAGDN